MIFREKERKKAVNLIGVLFEDPGKGVFLGKPRDFVLNNPELNLWDGIREDILAYFKRNKIQWWMTNTCPCGHLLSSQISCINHLFYLKDNKDYATAFLNGIDSEVAEAVRVDEGYVEFEFIGEKQYLAEKSWSRGANCTSIDAAMIGKNIKGEKKFFLIEWKYTEYYRPVNLYIPQRAEVYDFLITAACSPFKDTPVKAFYFEPFYQLMRQTLLAWLLVAFKDHECTDYCHINVIPDENEELLKNITSPYLTGDKITGTWKSVLKTPEKYKSFSPQKLLRQYINSPELLLYLENRYW